MPYYVVVTAKLNYLPLKADNLKHSVTFSYLSSFLKPNAGV